MRAVFFFTFASLTNQDLLLMNVVFIEFKTHKKDNWGNLLVKNKNYE